MINMNSQPTLYTQRLILRPFELSDSKRVQELAGDPKIAQTTLNIPHPYEDGMAEFWINTHKSNFEQGKLATFAMVTKEDNTLIGCIGLIINDVHKKAELGYWLGVPYWNRGYCSEAGREILRYGFETMGLNKIYALSMADNPGSYSVMEKLGMSFEGTKRQDVIKWGEYKDLKIYSILENEFRNII
jgi:[ribosomal protein S5]-alanine N-acetyltransferase